MKNIKVLRRALIFLLCLWQVQAYCQTGNDVLDKVTQKLKTYMASHDAEKAYLHFDKPYYAAGDTMYFKAYVTLGEKHQLSGLSGILHVELINTGNKIDQSIKLHLVNGVGWGDFALPDSLPRGNYRVRAYTQWMRNEGDDSYFDKVIPVGSTLNNKIPESGTKRQAMLNAKPEIQFFPEGGDLVAGVTSKVAFKAIGTNGAGIDATGVIVDEKGAAVAKFNASHLGMGSFYLNPDQGKTYRAAVSFANGTQDTVKLPQVNSNGVVLRIDSDNVYRTCLQVAASKSYFAQNQGKDLHLLIYSGGSAITVTSRLDSAVASFTIFKRKLRTGITRITLFSAAGEPLSERLLFIQNPGQLNVTINSDKDIFNKREKVTMSISAATRADSAMVGHFSVSVIDESKVSVDENSETNIYNYLLLTSDLKGYIEQPNYYFTNVNETTAANLDLVMLTHGYRRFEWKALLNNTYPPLAYQPETSLEIAGVAKSVFGKPVDKGTVSLISMLGGPVLSQVTDEKGNFSFKNLVFMDTSRFVVQAVKANGKNTTKLSYIDGLAAPVIAKTAYTPDNDINQQMHAYLENTRIQLNDYSKFGKPGGILLNEVKIKDKKRFDDYKTLSLAGAGNADQVLHGDDLGDGMLADQLNGRLSNVQFIGPPAQKQPYLIMSHTGAMLVIIDGVQGADLNLLNPEEVETVEVLKYASSAVYGVQGGNGVLVITTKQAVGKVPKYIASIGVLPIKAKGYYKAREFYVPKYDQPQGNMNRIDLRSTIFWKPELVTDKEGNASFEYFNADGTGNYRVIVEGIDVKGNLCSTSYVYKVK